MSTGPRHGPLEGIRVLAVENYLAGPYGSMMLADFGAEVIKVEPPGGEVYREKAPVYENEHGRMSYAVARTSRNKSSVVLDLKDPEDVEAFWSLVDDADVVWENLRAGAMGRLGFGWDALHERNPRVIYASISGFGHADVMPSPFQDRPAFDLIAQALSGLMLRPGDDSMPPLYLGAPFADVISGVYGAIGVTLALRRRALTGEGSRVDVAMLDVMTTLMDQSIAYHSYFGESSPRGASPTSAPFGAYQCQDGWFVIAVSSNDTFRRLCEALESPELADDERMQKSMDRVAHRETVLKPWIEAWAADKGRDQVIDHLNAAGVPSAQVHETPDLFSCPHVEARGMLVEIDDPIVRPMWVPASPVKLSEWPEIPLQPAPLLGVGQDHYLAGRARGT